MMSWSTELNKISIGKPTLTEGVYINLHCFGTPGLCRDSKTLSLQHFIKGYGIYINFDNFILTLKAPRKTASENVVCLCRLLNILANFSDLFLHTGKQCGPRSDCS